jgi:hypothetical protein
MKQLITERFRFVIDWLKKEGYFKTHKELGELVGINNKSTLSATINGIRVNHSFVERVCALDSRININWVYSEDESNMLNDEQPLKANKFAEKEASPQMLRHIEALEALLSYKDKEIAELKALIAELKSR